MSRNENVNHALERARKARARFAPAAARVKPLAGKAGAATARRLRRTRSWAAPQVKRAGEVLEDNVAPKVSALMSSAAERIDPDQPRRHRGSGATATTRLKSAARAATTRLRSRARRAPAASADGADAASADGADAASADGADAASADGADAASADGADAAGTSDTVATPTGEPRADQPATADGSGDEAGSRAHA